MNLVRGRPRGFDVDDTLEHALQVFWRQGFQAAALSELTRAMGLTRPSLYAAYGDKQGLYAQALQRYVEHRLAPLLQALDAAPDLRVGLATFLVALARLFSQGGGCFVVNGLADVGGPTTPPEVSRLLLRALGDTRQRLTERLRRGQREGQLARRPEAADLSGYVMTLMAGLAMRAKAGAPLGELEAAIRLAARAWAD